MTETARRGRGARTPGLLFAVAAACLLAMAPAARAAQTLRLGYVELRGDARYEQGASYAGIRLKPRGRPYAGAEEALRESTVLGRALGIGFALERYTAADAADAAAWIGRRRSEAGIGFFLVDADSSSLAEIGRATRGQALMLLNVSATGDALRGARCERQVMHVMPSDAMLMDALVQYLASRSWRRVLVLRGPLPRDALLEHAFERAAGRFGARLVAVRDFVLSNDPRQRGRNNVALLTAGTDYDVVFLADTDGEFGRYVPYQTSRPRPVVGTEGLMADAWHWSWERYGAPQLNQRFERRAKRHMQGADWAAWAAVKSVVEAVVRTRSTDFASVAKYLRGDALTVDGYKGAPMSVRPWDNQMRQPILVHTHDAVANAAPLPGFLHPTQNLDTLGFDRPESTCRFP